LQHESWPAGFQLRSRSEIPALPPWDALVSTAILLSLCTHLTPRGEEVEKPCIFPPGHSLSPSQ
jgi:hypothetical protein